MANPADQMHIQLYRRVWQLPVQAVCHMHEIVSALPCYVMESKTQCTVDSVQGTAAAKSVGRRAEHRSTGRSSHQGWIPGTAPQCLATASATNSPTCSQAQNSVLRTESVSGYMHGAVQWLPQMRPAQAHGASIGKSCLHMVHTAYPVTAKNDSQISMVLQAKHTEDAEELRNITADVSECAAQGSLLLGHAVGWEGSEVRESLASNGFMGSVTDWDADAENKAAVPHCIFAAQQQQFSLAQTGLYNRHVAAANDTDEDFLGHFS